MSLEARLLALTQSVAADVKALNLALTTAASTSKTTTQVTDQLVTNANDILQVANTAVTQIIAIARMCQVVYSGAANINVGGHPVGILGNCSVMAGAGNAPQAIGVEGRVDVYSGYTKTLAAIKPLLSLANLLGGTHPLLSLLRGEAGVAAGVTVQELRGQDFTLLQQLGSVGTLIGTHFPDLSGFSGIAQKWAFMGNDAAAPISNKAPVVSRAYGYTSPGNNGTVTIPPMISDFQLIGGSTLAMLTINLPSPANTPDGLELTVGSQMAITAMTLNAPGGATILSPTTMLAAGGHFRYKFYGAGLNYWVKR